MPWSQNVGAGLALGLSVNPDFPINRPRIGAALQLDPQNQATKQQLEEAMAGRASSRSPAGGAGGLGGLFGPDFMAKLATNPQTRSYLADPSFMQLLQSIQSNPQNLNMALADPRFQQAMSVRTSFVTSDNHTILHTSPLSMYLMVEDQAWNVLHAGAKG